MSGISRLLSVSAVAALAVLLPATPAAAGPGHAKVSLLCMPSYAPEGFVCRSLAPGKKLAVRAESDMPRGVVLRFMPLDSASGGPLVVPLSRVAVRRGEIYKFTVPQRLCQPSGARYEVQILGSDMAQAGSAGMFRPDC